MAEHSGEMAPGPEVWPLQGTLSATQRANQSRACAGIVRAPGVASGQSIRSNAKDWDMNAAASYRDHIYRVVLDKLSRCGTDVRRCSKPHMGYRHYFRGWFPDRKDAAILGMGCGSEKLLHHSMFLISSEKR